MTTPDYRCICDPANLFAPPDPRPVAVEGCTAHIARRITQQLIGNPMTDTPPAQNAPTPPDPDDPIPVQGLTLQALQSLVQDVEHCGQPMRFVVGPLHLGSRLRGDGPQHQTTTRCCITCGATLTTTSTTPS